jgi:GT2 family glycosyltransferase
LPTQGNVGFGAAHNRMMRQAFDAGAEVYIALNPDGALHPDALAAMLRMHRAARGCAVIEALQFPEEHPKPHDPLDFATPWASGACMLIPGRVHRAIGGFDDRFFMYCEDVDLSWRARAAGFAVKTCVPALFFHPTAGRTIDTVVHGRFLSSGLRLAIKWGNTEFAETVREHMRQHGVPIPDIACLPAPDIPPGIADFSHMFSFAPVRW